MSGTAGSSEFRDRAHLEANRYGPDPWVFVRELLQNARDAGATRVNFEVQEAEGQTRVTCTDDGEGMSYEHARRYLFSLYASSKEDAHNQVGRFGVGFWSVLRFDPSRIVIRSCPATGQPWEIALDGALEHAEHRRPEMEAGTQVVLEKAFSDGSQVRRVHDAAEQNARFLCQRDRARVPLRITVNGEPVNAAFTLRPPSASFSRGDVRGVVGLGAAPRVELFSRGLRVRSAACLDDLLSSAGHTSHSRVRFPELPGALAPQALLESEGLELLLSRSDARENRSLRKLVDLANVELEHLVDRQLAQLRPPGVWERIGGWRRRVFGESLLPRVAVAVGVGCVLAIAFARALWGPEPPSPLGGVAPEVPVAAAPLEAAGSPEGYADLAVRYRGPRVSELDPTAHAIPIPLRYEPPSAGPYFAALVVADLDGGTGPLDIDRGGRPRPYLGEPCETDCVDVELALSAAAGPLRIPVPTGHRLDTSSVRLDGEALRVHRTTSDEPTLVLDRARRGTLVYRTGPAPAPDIEVAPVRGLPDDLLRQARRLRASPLDARVRSLVGLVQTRVRYSTSREVAARHHAAIVRGAAFVDRTLDIGAGDCDVQNGLLVTLLQAADVPARLAVGYVGREGTVLPWLHAWAEYRDERGVWRIADASAAVSRRVALPSADSHDASDDAPTEDPRPATAFASGVEADGPQVGSHEPLGSHGPIEPGAVWAWTRWTFVGIGSLIGLIAAVWFGLALRGRTRRSLLLDEDGDLSKLLHGALQRPAAFRHLPALFHRKLIPLADGGALSLNRARELAGASRLFRSRDKTGLAARALRRRVEILDDARPEACTVGDTLGATDLDRWSDLLDRARRLPVLDRVNAYLRGLGVSWEVMAIEAVGESVASLDLRALRLGGRPKRVVLIHARDPWLLEAEDRLARRPATAVLLLLDHLLERLDLGPDRRAWLLAPQARAALLEVHQ